MRVMQAIHKYFYACTRREAGPMAESKDGGDTLLRRRVGRVMRGGVKDGDSYRRGVAFG